MDQKLIVLTDGNEFAACFTENGKWHAEVCATAKAAYDTLAFRLEANCKYALSQSAYNEAYEYFEEDAKEHPDYSSFHPDMMTFLNELSWGCSQHKNKLTYMKREDKAFARRAFFEEQSRLL